MSVSILQLSGDQYSPSCHVDNMSSSVFPFALLIFPVLGSMRHLWTIPVLVIFIPCSCVIIVTEIIVQELGAGLVRIIQF